MFAPFASVLVSVLNPAVNFQMNEYELPNFYDYFLHICLFLKNWGVISFIENICCALYVKKKNTLRVLRLGIPKLLPYF